MYVYIGIYRKFILISIDNLRHSCTTNVIILNNFAIYSFIAEYDKTTNIITLSKRNNIITKSNK